MTHELGAVPSPYDPRDYPVAMRLAVTAPTVPNNYRLTSVVTMPPTYTQPGPTCVTSSFSGMGDYHERSELGTSIRLDDGRFYNRCKEVDGYPDEGTFPRVALDIWKNEGIYTINGRGPDHQRIAAYYAVPATERDIARVVYEKRSPVSLVINWPARWDGMPSSGIAPTLPENPTYRGFHQMWIWGHDFTRSDHGLLLRNSWGREWGLNGSFWLGSQAWTLPMIGEAWFPESRP